MRWRLRVPPECGDLRDKIRFAIFPVRCVDYIVVWLEKYIQRQKYYCGRVTPDHNCPRSEGWRVNQALPYGPTAVLLTPTRKGIARRALDRADQNE